MNDGNSPRYNLNTIMLAITLGVLSVMGWMGYNNSIALATINGSMVSRPELEAKLAEIKTHQAEIDAKTIALRLDFEARFAELRLKVNDIEHGVSHRQGALP